MTPSETTTGNCPTGPAATQATVKIQKSPSTSSTMQLRTSTLKFVSLLGLVLLATTLFTSCEKEVIEPGTPGGSGSALSQQPGSHSKDVVLTSSTGSVKLRVSSDNTAALEAFVGSATLRATAEGEAAEAPQTGSESAEPADESGAVHVSVLESDLASFEIAISSPYANMENDPYKGFTGPYYFYSFDAPHSFTVTPGTSECLTSWLYENTGAGWSYVSWAGGAAGHQVCSLPYTTNSSETSVDFRLKTQGTGLAVSWE